MELDTHIIIWYNDNITYRKRYTPLKKRAGYFGILGTVIAAYLALTSTSSIFWGLFWGAFGWLYVAWFAIFQNPQLIEIWSNLRWF